MTITSVGYERAINYAELGRMLAHAGAEYSVFGQDAFACGVGVGTREIIVQPGEAYGHGILDTSDAAVTLTGATVATGNRWDLVALRRNWVTGDTSLVLIQGGATRALPTRETGPGDQDDQPLFLARFAAGQAAVQDLVDVRCWAGSGGGLVARDLLVRDYLSRIGSRVRIQGVAWILAYDGASPAWAPDSVYVGTTAPPYADNLVWAKVP
ncbi:MAG TPA: hypothetical protein VIP82_20735 [Microbacterium sp.]|uniref:hypothetical protein n=1 Tax=Microbacterium sp. TaxID=51671 RepID=UPI002F94A062